MSPYPRNVVCMTGAKYRALYNPMEQHMDDPWEISDEESRVRNTQREDIHEEEEVELLPPPPSALW